MPIFRQVPIRRMPEAQHSVKVGFCVAAGVLPVAQDFLGHGEDGALEVCHGILREVKGGEP